MRPPLSPPVQGRPLHPGVVGDVGEGPQHEHVSVQVDAAPSLQQHEPQKVAEGGTGISVASILVGKAISRPYNSAFLKRAQGAFK